MRIAKRTHIPWYLRPFFWNQKRKYGQELEPAKIWANSPAVFASLALLYGALDRQSSPLSRELRSLVTVRVSQINWCRFCVDINSAKLIKIVGSEQKVLELEQWRTSTLFSEQEKAALTYAEQVTYTDQHPGDHCFADLRRHFSEDAIIELTAVIAFQNMSSKFNSALEVEPQGFCQLSSQNFPINK